MLSVQSSLLLLSGINAALGAYIHRRGVTPTLPYDENTTNQCTWWHDQTTDVSCDTIIEENWIDLATFRRWNPSVGADCAALTVGRSYCVEAAFEPVPTPAPTTATPVVTSTSSSVSPSSTAPSNGIETPLPTQPQIVDNCDDFYMVNAGEGCEAIALMHGITLNQFLTWNPSAGANCAGLWKDAYACVSIVGHSRTSSTSTSKPAPTSTKPANGIETPQPTQPGMVGNCDKFHWVAKGVTCSQIISFNKITLAQFAEWNPTVGSDCSGMWAEVNVCVSVIGHSPTTSTTVKPTTTKVPTPTSTGNGIATPTPTQPGMVSNCDKFHWISPGNVCSQITSYNRITLAQFAAWNPSVKSDCSGLWASVFVCVSVIGHSS